MKTTLFCAFVFLAVVALAAGTEEEEETPALKCYQCNSKNENNCVHLGEEGKRCKQRLAEDQVTMMDAVVCRKTIMYLDEAYTKELVAEERVVYSCGYEDDTHLHRFDNCYYRSGFSTKTWTCSCKGDSCNSAALPAASGALILAVAVLGRVAGAV